MQPSFHCVANLGDENPLIHGGAFVMVDRRGIFSTELLILEPVGNDHWSDPTSWNLYTILCERLTAIMVDGVIVALSDNQFRPHLPALFATEDNLKDLSKCFDVPVKNLITRALDSNPVTLASFYLNVYNFNGLDSYPEKLTIGKAKKLCNATARQMEKYNKLKDGYGF
jgi:hypothetical protein